MAPDRKYPVGMIGVLAVVLAFCSIVYELMMAQALTDLSGDPATCYSVVIGLYLGAMGLGAFLCNKKRRARAGRSLLRVELALSVLGGGAVLLVHFSHMLFMYLDLSNQTSLGAFSFFGVVYGVVALLGVLTGLELPLLMHMAGQNEESSAGNAVLGFDYIGTVIGALCFPLILLPWLDVLGTGLLTAGINALVAGVVLVLVRPKRTMTFVSYVVANVLIIAVLVTGAGADDTINQYLLKKYYIVMRDKDNSVTVAFAPVENWPDIRRYRSPYQNIDIVQDDFDAWQDFVKRDYSTRPRLSPEILNDTWLFINRDFQFCGRTEEIYHEYLAHLPIVTNHVPKRVLVLGAGDGILVKELLRYKDIQSVELVELDPMMIRLARTDSVLTALNGRSFEDKRVTVTIADAYSFMRRNDRIWDAIFIDFPAPISGDIARLYSREFYTSVRKALAEDGFVAMDGPASSVAHGHNIWAVYYDTLRSAGWEQIVPYTSLLEVKDPVAERKFVRGLLAAAAPPQAKPTRAEIHRSLADYRAQRKKFASDNARGYIILKKNGVPPNLMPVWPSMKFQVLTPERCRRALSVVYPRPEGIDPRNVNSVFHPALPKRRLFAIKKIY